LAAWVTARLKLKWSPEQVSARLRLEFPDDPEMRVSHETIYRSVYVQGKGGLKHELTNHLRTRRAQRKPRRAGQRAPGPGTHAITDPVMISDRPPEVDQRRIPGHWEGDLITGRANKSAIGTLVERSTRYTLLLHLPDKHGAAEVRDQIVQVLGVLPDQLRRSLTWDQGVEMADHAAIAVAADLDVYFCDPHSPWQRGTNENTNALLRQYFPKGTDLSIHDRVELDRVANLLNTRPRKTLQWQTPAEALAHKLNSTAKGSVATTP
jgi:IS30 family transposase